MVDGASPQGFWVRKSTRNFGWGIGAVAMGLFLWFVGVPCPLFEMTGLYCPGCGATRAVKALAHGDFWGALHDNAWMFLFAGPAMALSAATSVLNPPDQQREWIRRFLLVTAYAAGVFMILRNLHFAPFNLLAPIGD